MGLEGLDTEGFAQRGFLTTRATRGRYGATERNRDEARAKILAAMDRIEAEVGPSGYLVGDAFSLPNRQPVTGLIEKPHRRLPPRVLRRGRRRGARRGGATRVRPEDDDPGHERQERGGHDHRDERAARAARAARGRRLPQVTEHLRGRVVVRQKIRAVHPRRIRVDGRR